MTLFGASTQTSCLKFLLSITTLQVSSLLTGHQFDLLSSFPILKPPYATDDFIAGTCPSKQGQATVSLTGVRQSGFENSISTNL